MSERFSGLSKIPKEPAARMLAMANAKLATKLSSPASASVETVLLELDQADALIDMLRLLAIALPPRESAWWACLAARDTLDPEDEKIPLPLAATEKWVFKPSDENREAARTAIENTETGDDTELCALAVAMCDGTLGPGDMAEYPAPPGGAATAVFGMNMISLELNSDNLEAHGKLLIDRALEIARGRSGRMDDGEPSTDAG